MNGWTLKSMSRDQAVLYVPATTSSMAVHVFCAVLSIITVGLGLIIWIPIIVADSARSERNLIIREVDGVISQKVIKV